MGEHICCKRIDECGNTRMLSDPFLGMGAMVIVDWGWGMAKLHGDLTARAQPDCTKGEI